jgi:alkylhydroperoxidase/carboxymuconolactone decarboxylase family protein YurZ
MPSGDYNFDLIGKVKEKRGYLLPFHELFLCIDPVLLETYDQFYENLTLKNRHLDNKTKELVWIGILMSVFEEAGSIHLKRGRDAGITDDEISDIVMITQVAKGFEVLLFVETKWKDHIPNVDPIQIYENLIDHLIEKISLPRDTAELVLIGIYAALPVKEALRFHLKRAKEYGLRDEEIAEAMSFIFIPRGGNVLIEAAQVLKDVIQEGELKPESVFRFLTR